VFRVTCLRNCVFLSLNHLGETEIQYHAKKAKNRFYDNQDIPYRAGMFDISNITYIDQEAREYLASGDDVNGKIVGTALISTSFLGKTIGNMFLSLGNPSIYPTKYLDSPIRAEHWLRSLMREAMLKDSYAKKAA
jgi:hypothetical protein